jgi:hypothetical protein
MYSILIVTHSYIRWLVVAAILYAFFLSWKGLLGKAEWRQANRTATFTFVWAITIQFLLGATLFFYPFGLAQTSLQVIIQDFDSAMKVRDLRFFGMEHPLQMTIVFIATHLGGWFIHKSDTSAKKFRWAAICFTLVILLIFTGIPWWRPLLRGF